jgi:ferredoxin
MKTSKIQIARRVSLGFFLVLVTALAVLHQRLPGFPSIDGMCPFGGLETLYAYVAGGELIKNIQPGNIVLMVAILVLGIVGARFFCGWICAFGALQGIFGWMGRKLFRRRFNLPAKLDSVLRYLKYVALALILVFTWQAGSLVIRPYDPWVAYGHLSGSWTELWGEFAVGLVILAASLVLSLFTDRAFCKYVCPLGAVNAILGRIPLLRIKREPSSCTSCSLCSQRCPMDIKVAKMDTVKSPECIDCFECVSNCPTGKGKLKAVWAGRAAKLGFIAAAGLGIYVLSIGIGNLLGMAKFGPVSLEVKAKEGAISVTDIKGSSTWAEIAAGFKVDAAELMRASGVDPAKVDAGSMLKSLVGSPEHPDFTPDTARVALARMIGVEYAGEEGEGGEGEGEAMKAKEAAVAPASPAKTAEAAHSGKPAAEATAGLTVPADFNLEGTMSIQEVAAALGGSAAQVVAKLKLPAAIPTDKPLRDLKADYGYTMPELKARIHE